MTTFMVLYDMLRNANRVSLDDIVRVVKRSLVTATMCFSRLKAGTGGRPTWQTAPHLSAHFAITLA